MIRQTVITSLVPYNTTLSGKYYDKNRKLVHITIDGDVVSSNEGITKELEFTNTVKSYTLTHNTEDKNAKKREKELMAWSQHPQIECEGNENLKEPMFKMVDKAYEINKKALDLIKKIKVANIVENYSGKEMRNLAFWFGLNPINKSPEQIFIDLVDFNSGVVMKDSSQFLKDFSSPDVEYVINAKKAIALNIVEHKNQQYYLKQEIIGDNIDSIVAYFKQNEDMYENFIYKEIAKKDVVNGFDGNVKNIIGKQLKDKEDAKIEMEELRAIAKEIDLPGYFNMKLPTLRLKVAEAQKKVAQPA